jgi:hypothetical protein
MFALSEATSRGWAQSSSRAQIWEPPSDQEEYYEDFLLIATCASGPQTPR